MGFFQRARQSALSLLGDELHREEMKNGKLMARLTRLSETVAPDSEQVRELVRRKRAFEEAQRAGRRAYQVESAKLLNRFIQDEIKVYERKPPTAAAEPQSDAAIPAVGVA